MKKIFKFLLWILIWSLIGAACVGGALFSGAPISTGLKIFAGIFIAYLAFILIRKAVIHYRAKKKVESLVNVAEPEERKRALQLWRKDTGLDKNFKAVVKMLNGSYLKAHGNPLYVLPWYLVIGHERSGKTFSFDQANLPKPTIESDALVRSEGNINWHLYNQAIALDTPGQFLAGVEGSRNNEWLKLLSLLKKHRHKEPVNGVIVSLPMDVLLEGNSQKLIEMGTQARKNLEQLIQVLHIQVPIYLMVTRLDSLPGIPEWISTLDQASLRDPVGMVNQKALEPADFVSVAIETIAERLKQLQLAALQQQQVNSDLILLPTRFEQLERHLTTYANSIFQENPYQKTPLFRGIYFVGEARGIELQTESEGRGIFSNRFLTEIVPAERGLLSSLSRSERVETTRQLGRMAVWYLVTASVFGTLYSSYRGYQGVLEQMTDQHAGSFEESVALEQNINTMYEYRSMVDQLADSSWTPWFGLNAEQPAFVNQLQGIFAERVQSRLVAKADQEFSSAMASALYADSDVSEEEIVSFISTLVRRINILDAYMDGASESTLSSMPLPYSENDADLFGIQDVATVDKLNDLYIRSLLWTADQSLLEQELKLMDDQLRQILIKSKALANWLIPWADGVAESEQKRISDFWIAGSGSMKKDIVVTGAFTLEGKQAIDDFIDQIRDTNRYDEILDEILPGFQSAYQKQYLKKWEAFALNFFSGSQKLRGRDEWLAVINNLSTGRNIFFNALDLIDKQIKPYEDADNLPDWAQMVGYYQDMRAFGPDEKTDNGKQDKVLAKMAMQVVGKAGPVGKALAGGAKSGMKSKKKLDKAAGKSGPSVDEREMQLEQAGKLLGDYRQSLRDFVYAAETRSVSHNAIAALYTTPDQPDAGESSLAMGYASLKKLQALVGKENRENRAFWSLYDGALDLMRRYMVSESACEVQHNWENSFLANIEGVPEYKLPELVFGDSGLLWNTLTSDLAPFVQERYGAGYVAQRALGEVYPLSKSFLGFAARAKDARQAKQDTYRVDIKGMPTSTNLDAKYHVSQTKLELRCADDVVALTNLNFPVTRNFSWNTACSDVTLSINIGRFTLEKRYEGPLGFPYFLKEFATGQKRFTPSDFPTKAEQLRESGISYMEVEYRIRGQEALLSSLDNRDLVVPKQIAACWPTRKNRLAVVE